MFKIQNPTTLVSGTFQFEASFESYNLKLACVWKCPIRFVIQIFLPFLCGNLKNLEHESCSTIENLQLWFEAKVHSSNILKVIFNTYLRAFELNRYFVWPLLIWNPILLTKFPTSARIHFDAFYWSSHGECEKHA